MEAAIQTALDLAQNLDNSAEWKDLTNDSLRCLKSLQQLSQCTIESLVYGKGTVRKAGVLGIRVQCSLPVPPEDVARAFEARRHWKCTQWH